LPLSTAKKGADTPRSTGPQDRVATSLAHTWKRLGGV
jgi:hypothetical protein